MYKLLIVEDEPLIRTGLKRYFDWESFGISTIIEAENGKDGLNMSLIERPDLIITDIRMPRMTGLEMIKEIRNVELETNIIILTGYNDFDYAQKAIQYGGVHSFLLKPLQYQESYLAVSSCMKDIANKSGTTGEQDEQITDTNRIQDNQLLFQQIEAYILKNLHEDFTLETVANHFFYNASYLSRLFKNTINTNYLDFVREIKIKIAMKHLENHQLSINEVSVQSGFKSYKNFLKTFRIVTKMTPTEYRRQLR